MTKRQKQRIERCGLLQSRGWKIDSLRSLNQIETHSGEETPKHILVKALLCKAIKDKGSSFATEVRHTDRGIADVMDINEESRGAYIYEVETNCDRQRAVEKARQYTDEFSADEILDCFVIDPTEAPDDINECAEWCAEKVV